MPEPRAKRFLTLFSRGTAIPSQPPLSHRRYLRTIFDGTLKPVRDRGLDHAVERERNLKPLLSLKNLIKNEPSKSLPLSLIKQTLNLPFRPIEFIRRYPSVFQEFLPGGISPHVRLTPDALRLDAEEQLLNQTDRFKQRLADRLLKLLMISRVHKIPLRLLERLKWDLALPHDYVDVVVPEFPDCFRVVDEALELVCWSNELAVSVMKKNANSAFPLQFSNGFEMDKSYEKWLREWNKMRYWSPYENLARFPSSSDESDRWVVAVLHEVLHVFVGKKIEKESLLMFGEWLGLRSRFKRALLQHPGIFYVSSKIGTYTVVLREGYKRGSLIEDDPVVNLRNQYVHLMNIVKEDSKTCKVVQGKGGVNEDDVKGSEGAEGEGEGEGERKGDENSEEKSDQEESEVEGVGESDGDDNEDWSRRGGHKVAADRKRGGFGNGKVDVEKPLRDSRRGRLNGKPTRKTTEKNPSEVSKRLGVHKDVGNKQRRSRSSKGSGKLLTSKKTPVF